MSFDEVWPRLTALRADETAAAPLRWKVMYARRAQPLLLPAADRTQALAAVGFFVRKRSWRGWARLLLLLDRWLPEAGLLPGVRLDHFPLATLFGADGCAAIALYCGSPGPLQKLTVLCRGAAGEGAQVAKIALRATADGAIAHEAHWLRVLGASADTAAFLPRFCSAGELPGGRRFVVMSGLPDGVPGKHFERRHRDFLALLAQRSRTERATLMPAVTRLRERLHAVRGLLNDAHRDLLDAVQDEVETVLAHQPLPACLVHGDFAPWNIRLTPERLFVFDWEYAQAHGNPLQDYLHFHLMPRVLQARRWLVRPGFMRALLAESGAHARDLFGADSGVAEAAGTLAAHYLLDTVTFYVEASGYMDARHPVMRAYLHLLEKRRRWARLPADIVVEGRVGYGG